VRGQATKAIWHDVECGAYTADLGLWEELADEAIGGVLELGCGTGRVGLRLAREGHPVLGLDLDDDLVAEFNKRATDLPASASVADARGFELDRKFGLVLAPMQLVQLLAGSDDRLTCLRGTADHLEAGGLAAFAIVEDLELTPPPGTAPPLPDVRQTEGWIYSSQPLDAIADSGSIVVRRLRQTVSPEGDLSDEVDEVRLRAVSAGDVESEAAEVGLRPIGRRAIPATEAHVGSTVVLLEKED
jgi:SAM-dependent methyltransferase